MIHMNIHSSELFWWHPIILVQTNNKLNKMFSPGMDNFKVWFPNLRQPYWLFQMATNGEYILKNNATMLQAVPK